MALNRYRLRALIAQGRRGAQQAASLLARTDRLLGVILIGNNEAVIAVATALVAFLIIVFAEITPKVIGATFPERVALPLSFVLKPLLALATPLVWFVNLFVNALLTMFRLRPAPATGSQRLDPEELRILVLESGHFIPQKHRSILVNLFDLERIRVDDVMTPRAQIEAIDIDGPAASVARQLATSHHGRLPVYRRDINAIVGIIVVRRALAAMVDGELSEERLLELVSEPYFIPAGTPVFQQLQYFQERRRRLALVVDEYGELQGLVTLEDILEEMIGEFTTGAPGEGAGGLGWGSDDSVVVDGSMLLRELNRALGTEFPLDGPKTVNGLLLEQLRDIPEAGTRMRIAGLRVEILQTQDRFVRTVRLCREPRPEPASPDAGE